MSLPKNLHEASKLLNQASTLICGSLTSEEHEPYAAQNFADAIQAAQYARKLILLGNNISHKSDGSFNLKATQ
jgi:hypothetical protein